MRPTLLGIFGCLVSGGLLAAVSLSTPAPASAETDPLTGETIERPAVVAPTKKPELPKSGSLSQTLQGGSSSRAVAEPWGGTDPSGKTEAPISGSVSRQADNKWLMRVFNNSQEETFSVNLSVDQFNSDGRNVKSDHFSYTLKPGQKAERKIDSSSNTANAALNLRSWRLIGGPKKAAAEDLDAAAAESAPAGSPE